MARIARRIYHRCLEEVTAWLEHFEDREAIEERELLVFTGEVMPRFSEVLPDLVETLNEHAGENVRAAFDLERYELISARVRRPLSSERRERQCIGPVIGAPGSCVGKGAATDGWQLESPDHFSRKREVFQARCKACDTLRSHGRQLAVARRAAAARHWRELTARAASLERAELEDEVRALSRAFLEELREDWWRILERRARRVVELGGDSGRQGWLAIDVDQQRIDAADSPEKALAAAEAREGSEALFVLIREEGR